MNEQTKQEVNNNPKPKKDWKALEVGAIWQFSDDRLVLKMRNKDGKDIRFVCFKNRFKDPNNRDDDRLPVWRVYKDNEEYNPTAAKTPKKSTPKVVEEKAPAPEQGQEEFV